MVAPRTVQRSHLSIWIAEQDSSGRTCIHDHESNPHLDLCPISRREGYLKKDRSIHGAFYTRS